MLMLEDLMFEDLMFKDLMFKDLMFKTAKNALLQISSVLHFQTSQPN
ncbi:hypothetical protein Pse7429DRAFT_1200 [Pseudanabaena biceps PCC 7429]|uniref:Uncharacterized protein n=1 Tax=Pseudanabaena biceps PCC 7429 TaxID=927668 RepID=L8N200_9CYAN|nr:hypothetical protein Pse7429DRAFT_1200 [Pseudanabaena biceps PCC 7429]